MSIRFGRVVSAATLVVAGALAATLVSRDAESATAAPGAQKTHLGVGGGDIVVLELVDDPSGPVGSRQFGRVLPNGMIEPNWRAPAGTALFATDVEWAAGWASAGQGPSTRTLRIRIVNDLMAGISATVMYAGVLPSESLLTPEKLYGGGSARTQTGFLLGPGATLAVDAPATLDAAGNPQTGPFLGSVVVRGYLVRAK